MCFTSLGNDVSPPGLVLPEDLRPVGDLSLIHISNVERAVFYLAKRGFAVDEGSARGKNGEMTSVYLQDEIGGFAVHLLKK